MSDTPPDTSNPAPAAPAPAPSAPANNQGNSRSTLASPLFLIALTIVVAALLFAALDYIMDAMTHESTDDAFIAGHIISVAPRIPGQVAAVHVLDNEMVHSNDLLVEIDPADYATTLAQKKAAADSENSSYKAAIAAYEMMGVKVKTAEADVLSSQADVVAAQSTEVKAKADFERAQKLRQDQTISAQEFDQAKAAADKAEADLISAQQKVVSDQSKVNEAKAQKDAAYAEAGAVFAQYKQAKTAIDAANLNLSYTKVYAPCDGRVTRKQVETGDFLQTGQQIMSIVPLDVWVVANFKESQLENMRKGQPVTVEVDALGGRKFRAHVDSVQAGSGAQFSLLPPENATGNFVKVVQRVPVKIIFDEALPEGHTLGPGLSVTPSVRVNTFTLPKFVLAIAAAVLALLLVVLLRFILNRNTGAK